MAKAKVITNIFDEIETSEGQEAVDIWGSRYLPIQWNNQLGLWEAPLEFWAGSMLELSTEVSQVRHGKNMLDSFLLESINIAPFAPPKVHWGYKDAKGRYKVADEPDWSIPGADWKSRTHILALMREAEDLTPVILTAGSNTGKHLLANVSAGQRRFRSMLKKIGKPNSPLHLFWMQMIAGPPVTVGEGEESSTIVPPVAPAPKNIHKMKPPQIARYLTDLYVGHDIKAIFDDGLLGEGQEWSNKQPERLQLGNGNGGSVASPGATIAAVLDDGTLWFPDLSEGSPREMKDCGMSVPGLFSHQKHADRAFSKLMRNKHISDRADKSLVWEAWRVELETRYTDQEALKESQMREVELRDPKMSAMDEVETEDEIPPAFR